MYLKIAISRIGNSTACSSFMAEIINAPLTKPEPNMRSAITPPASTALFGADAVHQQRRQEHAAGFEEDLQRVEEAVHLLPCSREANCEAK